LLALISVNEVAAVRVKLCILPYFGRGRKGSWSVVDGIVTMLRGWTVRSSNPGRARDFLHSKTVQISVSQTFLLAGPFWLRNIATDHDILADVNVMSG
jgi:hypothetical protein